MHIPYQFAMPVLIFIIMRRLLAYEMLPLLRIARSKAGVQFLQQLPHKASSRALSRQQAQPRSLLSIYSHGNSTQSIFGRISSISSSRIQIVRYFSSSSFCAAKVKPRQSIHKGSPNGEGMDDAQYATILEEQRQKVAELRAKDSMSELNIPLPEKKEPAVPAVDEREIAKAHRRELIAKMVEKHVPLQDTDKAIEMFNTLIFGFVKNDSMVDAQEVFSQMQGHDIPPNKTTFSLLSKGFAHHSPPMIDELQNLLTAMAGTTGLDVTAFNSLIIAFSAIGRACNAREMFSLMRSHSVVEDVSTCNLLLNTYAKSKTVPSLEYAEDILLWMRETGIRPDSATYTAIISCCGDNIARATDFYEASLEAAKSGQIPAAADETRLTAMIRVFAAAKELDLAQQFIQQFLAQYPNFLLSASNQGAIFYLNVACLQIATGFDALDAFLRSMKSAIPITTCKQVIPGLKLLPESVLSENEQLLAEWEAKLSKYGSQYLSTADADYWRICLIRWRKTYTPTPDRSD
jgi:pentatricopeptide repeat protein